MSSEMEGNNSHSSDTHQIQVVAPFVTRTYEMVSDTTNDVLIRWGSANNSFIVLDQALFSHVLLPSYFKHSNFSSFIRQLNTYGFRKMDPNRWEFAHKSFLRGQTHLLPHIVRRTSKIQDSDDAEDTKLLQEVGRLCRERQALEEELLNMSKRVQVTEMKSQQIMSFLSRVAEDPDFLARIISSKKKQLTGNKKRRLLVSPHQTSQKEYATNCLSTITSNDDGVAVVPTNPFDQDGSKLILSPELDINEHSSSVMAPGFPFSTLGEGFF